MGQSITRRDALRDMAIAADAPAIRTARSSALPRDQRMRGVRAVRAGRLSVAIGDDRLTFVVRDDRGSEAQRIHVDPQTGTLDFTTAQAPLLGFGEGGPAVRPARHQDAMRNGQGGYQPRTHGGRVPVTIAL